MRKIEDIVLSGNLDKDWYLKIEQILNKNPDEIYLSIVNSRTGSQDSLCKIIEILSEWIRQGKVSIFASGILSPLATVLYFSAQPYKRFLVKGNTATFTAPHLHDGVIKNKHIREICDMNNLHELFKEKSHMESADLLQNNLIRDK